MNFSEIKPTVTEFSRLENKSSFDIDKRAELPTKQDIKDNKDFDIDKRVKIEKNDERVFDNKSDIDENKITHYKTINEELEDKNHPNSGVPYERKVIDIDGKIIEGVFPEFDSKCDVELPSEMYKATDEKQFKYCTEKLAEHIKNDPELAKQFTPRQVDQIMSGNPR